MTAKILVDIIPPRAEIILNQPRKRNALSTDMWAELPTLIAQANDNPNVKTILIHGGMAGAFAAGADISEFETIYATPESARASGDRIAAALDAIEHSRKPVIAAIDGACVGGGVSIAMACDMRIAGEDSKFGVTPSKLGLVYPAADTRRLLAAVGPGATKDLLLTGRIFLAPEAKEMRLIDRLVETGRAVERARDLIDQICANSQWSTQATKAMIRGLQNGWDDNHAEAEKLFLEGFSNEDFRDGYKAFLEKRPPKFTFK